MALESGSRLGLYEIVSRLGAGGMGEVYRARDSRLGRDVAIKVLPDVFAGDPERLARFEREAKLLASLHHANVAVLHGLEEAGGRRFLVMECVEGESLAQRLARGALPPVDALEIAGAIAAGLEAAHEAGIVHRDLKPGNVMVTPSGDVKVLDFGLAKGGAGASSADASLSVSPTMTYAGTNAGVILGTAAYMSPEQARGKPVDRRTDIWSFGCVLYEQLAGRQAFAGETVSDIVASILQAEPDWTALPEKTPGRVRDLLVRCLQKDARRRLRDIGDARIELEDVIAGRVSASGAHLAPPVTLAPRRWWLVPAVAALVVAAAAAAWFGARALAPTADTRPRRFAVAGPGGQVIPQDAVAAQVSPDGGMLAILAVDSSGVQNIWIRSMDSLVPRKLPGTENATMMFWSPDSRSLAFFAGDRQLSRIAIAGGAPEPICDVKTARGGSWNRDGVILVAPYSNGAIYRVPATGGELVPVVRPDSAHGETALRFPQFLPDGRHFVYSSLPFDSSGKARVCVGSLDGGATKLLLRAESEAVYAEPGWLLCTRRGVIVAQRFNARALELRGDPVVLGDITTGTQFGGGPMLSTSRNGVLAFPPLDPTPNRLAWFDVQGHSIASPPVPAGLYFGLRLSPDGRQALMVGLDSHFDNYIALVDLERGMVSRATPTGTQVSEMLWAPDGRGFACVEEYVHSRIVTRSLVNDSVKVYVTSDPAFKRLDSWSSDGRFLIFERLDSATKWDIWVLPLDGSGPPRPLLQSAANETHSALSPDGRWIAFESDESGTTEIYVMPFGRAGMRYQVTSGGGAFPVWTADGKRLLLLSARDPNSITQAEVLPGNEFGLGGLHPFGRPPQDNVGFDPDRSGSRILALVPAEKARPQSVTILQNWTAAVRKP